MAQIAETPPKHPLEAELLALQQGLFHVNELDAPAIQIEGDWLAFVTNVQNSTTVAWDLMLTWQRTMDLLPKLDT